MLKSLHRYLFPKPPKRQPRERFLLPHEWAIIRPILQTKPDKVRIFFTFLFIMGCRRDEARLMHWSHLDLTVGLWHKAKTKNGRRQVVPLPAYVCTMLEALPQHGPYVFCGATKANHQPIGSVPWSCTAVRYWWTQIRHEAGIEDVRIHDLRRSCASWMTMHGENLKIVQSVLDHTSLLTTQIYARLDLQTVRAALDRHAARVGQ